MMAGSEEDKKKEKENVNSKIKYITFAFERLDPMIFSHDRHRQRTRALLLAARLTRRGVRMRSVWRGEPRRAAPCK